MDDSLVAGRKAAAILRRRRALVPPAAEELGPEAAFPPAIQQQRPADSCARSGPVPELPGSPEQAHGERPCAGRPSPGNLRCTPMMKSTLATIGVILTATATGASAQEQIEKPAVTGTIQSMDSQSRTIQFEDGQTYT